MDHPKISMGEHERAAPRHVEEFLERSKELEAAVQRGDAVEITRVRSNLRTLFGLLTPEEQSEIRTFLNRQSNGDLILDESSTVNRNVRRLLNVPGIVTQHLAETVPHLAKETVRLIGLTIGMSTIGLYQAGKTVYHTFKKSA